MCDPKNRQGSQPRFDNNQQNKDRAEPPTRLTKEQKHSDAQVLLIGEGPQDPRSPETAPNIEEPQKRETGRDPQFRHKSKPDTATSISKQLSTAASRYCSINGSNHQTCDFGRTSAASDKPGDAAATCSSDNCAPPNFREERRLFKRLLKVDTLSRRKGSHNRRLHRRPSDLPKCESRMVSRSEPALEKVLSASGRRSFKKAASHSNSGASRDHLKVSLRKRVQAHHLLDRAQADETGQATSDSRAAGSAKINSTKNSAMEESCSEVKQVEHATYTNASLACKTNHGGHNTKLNASASMVDSLGAQKDGNNACDPESKSKLCRHASTTGETEEHPENCKHWTCTSSKPTYRNINHSTACALGQHNNDKEKSTVVDCIFTYFDGRQSEPTDMELIRSVSDDSLNEQNTWEHPKSSLVSPPQVRMNLEVYNNPPSTKLNTMIKKSGQMSQNGKCSSKSSCSTREKPEVAAAGTAVDAKENQGSKPCPSAEYVFVVDSGNESKQTGRERANSEDSNNVQQVKLEYPMPSLTSPPRTEMDLEYCSTAADASESGSESVNRTSAAAASGTSGPSAAELKDERVKALACSFREAAQQCTMLRLDREATRRKLEEAKFYLFTATNKVQEKRLELAQARREIDARDGQIRQLMAFQAEAQADIGSMCGKLSDLRRQLDAAETNCQSEIMRNHRNRAQIAQLEAQLNVKNAELATVTSALAERRHSEEELLKRLHKFQQQLTASSEEAQTKKEHHQLASPDLDNVFSSSAFERLEQRMVEMEARVDLLLQELRERNNKQSSSQPPLLNLHHRPDHHIQHHHQKQHHQQQHRKDPRPRCETDCERQSRHHLCSELLRGRLCQIVAASSRCLDALDQRHELERYLQEIEKLRRLIEKLLRESSNQAPATTNRADASAERNCDLPDP